MTVFNGMLVFPHCWGVDKVPQRLHILAVGEEVNRAFQLHAKPDGTLGGFTVVEVVYRPQFNDEVAYTLVKQEDGSFKRLEGAFSGIFLHTSDSRWSEKHRVGGRFGYRAVPWHCVDIDNRGVDKYVFRSV